MWPPNALQAVAQETRVFDGGGANDDVAQTTIDVFFDGVEISNAATQLNRNFISHRFEDGLDGREVLRFARKGAIEVDQVQAPCAFVEPALGHGRGVLTKRSGLVHVALFEVTPDFRIFSSFMQREIQFIRC